MTAAILTVEECAALEAERAPIDTPASFRTRALATIAALRAETDRWMALSYGADVEGMGMEARANKAEAEVTALRADLAKREAMRQVCYDKWQAAEDKLKAEREGRICQTDGLAVVIADAETERDATIARANRLADIAHSFRKAIINTPMMDGREEDRTKVVAEIDAALAKP